MTRAERRKQEKERSRKPVYYQHTLQQIQEINRKAVEDYKERMDGHVKKLVEDEGRDREVAVTGKSEDESMFKVLCLIMAVPTKILCEQFGWKPVHENSKK